MPLRYAYNTNGTAHHRLDDALALIAESGYNGVALTLDHHHLDPFAADWQQQAERLSQRLAGLRLGLVIETGARYLLDPRQKHEPTLISPNKEGRARRVEFLQRAIEIAAICGGEAVSFWAGVPQASVDHPQAWKWLRAGVAQVVEYAEQRDVVVALEPEPGMLVETVDDYQQLRAIFPGLRLALDLGHCIVTGERVPHAAVHEFAPMLGTVAIEDMRRGVHEHLPFGEGDMDVRAALAALHAIHFERLVCVELSRDSHRAHTMVGEALRYLKRTEEQGRPLHEEPQGSRLSYD